MQPAGTPAAPGGELDRAGSNAGAADTGGSDAAGTDAVESGAGAADAGLARPGFHPEIQGLRAVAVIAVVAHHLVGWPSGGFVGVDVFFVISGFLITGLLLRELESRGRISWTGFYRRRARRILPAAAVCLVVVVAASWILYRPVRSGAITVDAVWSALFAANWHFAAVGTDYLGSAGPVSPLEHFWSLAVEEQFYLLWPVLLAAVLVVAARVFHRPARRLIAIVLGLGAAASFAWAMLETADSPATAYFSTVTRGWEIAAGALLALATERLVASDDAVRRHSTRRAVPAVFAGPTPAGMSSGLRAVLSAAGLTLIGVALFAIDPATSVPGPWSAVPVAGALLLIAAAIGGGGNPLLTNPGVQYVGRISYSLYLWHFPVIVLATAVLPDGPLGLAVEIAVIAVLAVGSFHLIEDPFRRRLITLPRDRRRGIAWCAAAALILLVVTGVAAGWPRGGDGAAAAGPGRHVSAAHAQLAADVLAGDIEAALLATSWPDLTPAIDGLADAGRPPNDRQCATGLANPGLPAVLVPSAESTRPVFAAGDAAACAFGDPGASRLAVVVGDSMAISWIPLVQAVFEPRGYRIQGLTMSGCPFVATETRNPAANLAAYCPGHKAAVGPAIRSLRPDVVVISNTFDPWLRGEPDVGDAAVRYAGGQRSIIEGLGVSAPVYVLAPPPPGPALEDCATTLSAPKDCESSIPDGWLSFDAAMAASLIGAPRTTYIDTSGWFCGPDGSCPGFVGSSPTRRDAAGHVVPAYAQRLAPLLEGFLATGS